MESGKECNDGKELEGGMTMTRGGNDLRQNIPKIRKWKPAEENGSAGDTVELHELKGT